MSEVLTFSSNEKCQKKNCAQLQIHSCPRQVPCGGCRPDGRTAVDWLAVRKVLSSSAVVPQPRTHACTHARTVMVTLKIEYVYQWPCDAPRRQVESGRWLDERKDGWLADWRRATGDRRRVACVSNEYGDQRRRKVISP
ncbi:unnamed protein product [Soboliphyme baturini]|uniref:ShKT domain-containing protein n=1 Tax=Soboliphyme baturini TaxID=241478 RepID=A0A183IB90_9BILA|nr:unnamed protein product [Soboliphyme baturini]